MSREPKKLCEGRFYFSKFEFWNFEILGSILVKWTRCKIGVDALTQSARGRWPRAIFWQSHRAPMPLSIFWQSHRGPMPLSKFFSTRRHCPWCGASVGTTGSAPPALACCPWSVMRGLCWNHWFRPLCACVLPDLSQIYSGFIRIRVRSRRSDKNTVKNVYEMETRFMADLCRIYSPFELFQEERPKKRVQ